MSTEEIWTTEIECRGITVGEMIDELRGELQSATDPDDVRFLRVEIARLLLMSHS
jgi:hypothetical protein